MISLPVGELEFHVFVSIALFAIGAYGFLCKRSGLIALMCLELMLNGVNLFLMTFSKHHSSPDGASLFLFIVLVAAAEAAIALSIFVILSRRFGSVVLDDYRRLKG
ncbi:NADH-quinone oxidoreductase subunit NuoK [bacterium]|nr:NADH-quinone oxidoreductase subunit NuoK [bacterium]